MRGKDCQLLKGQGIDPIGSLKSERIKIYRKSKTGLNFNELIWYIFLYEDNC